MPPSDEPRALPPKGGEALQSIMQRPLDACARPRSTPSTQETGHLPPGIALAASNATTTVEPASRKGCAEATTPGVGDATTVRRIKAPRPNHQVRESSAGPYNGRCSRPGSEPRLPSPSTQGRQGWSCGLRITDWHASWEGRTTTTSSSATSPFSSLTLPGPGWSICLLRRSSAGTTWSRPSLEISKVRTYALGTRGISGATTSSQGNPCESTSGGFQSSAPSCPNITDSNVIGAFLAGTTCWDLVSKLGRKTPTKAIELMDIATKFASGQEAVEAIFQKYKQPQGRQKEDVPEASVQRGTKKKTRKKAQAKHDAVDADLVAAAEHRNPRKPPGGANMFDKMLKESCPYHRGPVKHTLEECDMLRRYFNKAGPSAEGGKDQGNNKKGGDKEEEFPEVHNCFMIYDGQAANASARHR
jgi:hypothetical protein